MASRPPRSDPGSIVALLSGPGRSDLAQYLVRQRWFAAKTRGFGALAVRDWATLDEDAPLVLLLLDVDGDRYHVPVTVAPAAAPAATMASLDGAVVIDAHDDPRFARRVLAAIAGGLRLDGRAGARSTPPRASPSRPTPTLPARRHARRQSQPLGDPGSGSCSRPSAGRSPAQPRSGDRALPHDPHPVSSSHAWRLGRVRERQTGAPTSRCPGVRGEPGRRWKWWRRPRGSSRTGQALPRSADRGHATSPARSPAASTPRSPRTATRLAPEPFGARTSRAGPPTSATWRPPTSSRPPTRAGRRRADALLARALVGTVKIRSHGDITWDRCSRRRTASR
jgi:hypothetical protein